MKKISFGYSALALAAFLMPLLSRAQEVPVETHHLETGDLFFHIGAMVLSLISTIYMLTLVSSFKGGLLEKVWKRFMWISVGITVLTVVLYVQEADIFHAHYLAEIIQMAIALLLISASYKTLKEVVIKS